MSDVMHASSDSEASESLTSTSVSPALLARLRAIDAKRRTSAPASDLDSPEAIRRRLEEGVASGQSWLAVDASHRSLYVLVAEVLEQDARLARVIPLSNDVADEEDGSLVIMKGTPLGVSMVAWPGYAAVIPVRLLRKPMPGFDPATTRAILDDDPDLARPQDEVRRGAARAGENRAITGEGVDAVNDVADDALPVHDDHAADVDEMVATLALWHDACHRLPPLESTGSSRTPARGELLRRLVRTLGVSPDEAAAIIGDPALLTDGRKAVLGPDLVADLAALPRRGSTLPADLLVEVDQPRWREAAARFGGGDGGRMALARSAFALAARGNGHGREMWSGMLTRAAEGA